MSENSTCGSCSGSTFHNATRLQFSSFSASPVGATSFSVNLIQASEVVGSTCRGIGLGFDPVTPHVVTVSTGVTFSNAEENCGVLLSELYIVAGMPTHINTYLSAGSLAVAGSNFGMTVDLLDQYENKTGGIGNNSYRVSRTANFSWNAINAPDGTPPALGGPYT